MFIIRRQSATTAILATALSVWAGTVLAETGVDTREVADSQAWQEVNARYHRALEGDAEAVDQAIDHFEKTLDAAPDNALVRAYLGSTYTLKARDAAVWNKGRWVERGLDTLDEAVATAPGHPRVRLLRAATAYNLPRVVGRYDTAREDFAILLDAIAERPDTFAPELKREIYFHTGAFALKEGEDERALDLLEKAAAVEESDVMEEQIATMLRSARNRNS